MNEIEPCITTKWLIWKSYGSIARLPYQKMSSIAQTRKVTNIFCAELLIYDLSFYRNNKTAMHEFLKAKLSLSS